MLTDPSFLAVTGRPSYVSPVLRGYILRERFFCDTVQMPGAVDQGMPDLDEDGTANAQDPFAYTMEDDNCLGCHRMMNPAGYGLSAYDTIGAYDPLFRGEPRDTAGYFFATDADEPFEGVSQMAERIAASEQATECMTRQWFRYAHGYEEGDEHEAILDELTQITGDSIRDMLIAIALSDTFRYR